jgi:hypothetical protein
MNFRLAHCPLLRTDYTNYPARHYGTGLIASSLPRCRLTAAAEADFGNKPFIAAVNRCATRNQTRNWVLQQTVKPRAFKEPFYKTRCTSLFHRLGVQFLRRLASGHALGDD